MSTQSGRLIKRQTARLCGSLLAAISLLLTGPFFSTQTVIATPSATTETSDPYANVPESISTSIEPSTSPVVGSYFRVEAISHVENYYSKECFLQKKDAEGHFEKVESFDTYSDYYSSKCVITSKEVDPEDAGSYRIVIMDPYTQSPLAKSAEFTISPEPIKFLDNKDSFEVPAISGWRAAEDETPHLQVATNANYTKWEKLSGPTLNLYGAYNGDFPYGLSEGTYQFKVTAYTSDKYSISRTVTVNAIKTKDPWILKSEGKAVTSDYLFTKREATVDVDPQQGGSSWNLWGAPAGEEPQLLKENLRGAFSLPQGNGDWEYRIDSLGPRGTVLRSFTHKISWLQTPTIKGLPSIPSDLGERSKNVSVSASEEIQAHRLYLEASSTSTDSWFEVTELEFDTLTSSWSGNFDTTALKGTGDFMLRLKAIGSPNSPAVYSDTVKATVHKGVTLELSPSRLIAKEGGSTTITASANNANSIAWEKCSYDYACSFNSTPLGSGNNYTFHNVSKDDEATYQVTAFGLGDGNKETKTFKLHVVDKDFQFPKPNYSQGYKDNIHMLELDGPANFDVIYWEFKAKASDSWVKLPDSASQRYFLSDFTVKNTGEYRFVVSEDIRSEAIFVSTDVPDNYKDLPKESSNPQPSYDYGNYAQPSGGGGGGGFFLLLIPLLLAAAIWFTPLRGMLGL